MPEFPVVVAAPNPARVHGNARLLTGHHPHWERRQYLGGIFRTDHFRTCSFCGSIHPADLVELLVAGGSWLEAAGKPNKRLLLTPNPIAGQLVCIGSISGPVFSRGEEPLTLGDKLKAPAAQDLCPTIAERLAGHYERPLYEAAPSIIPQPIFHDHSPGALWEQIQTASLKGESNVSLYRA
jgi:hypothetical protein